MTDNNKHEKKSEEFSEKQEALKLTEENLEQVTGGIAPPTHFWDSRQQDVGQQ